MRVKYAEEKRRRGKHHKDYKKKGEMVRSVEWEN
jgi:hypothetical protein